MTIEQILSLVTIVVTLIMGQISKKNKWLSNNLIPIQNIIIGVIMAIVEYIITKDFSAAITISGLAAGGIYDIASNLNKIKK